MQSRHSDFKRKMVLFALMVLVVALVASTAFAHTGLSTSSPADGETVSGPLDTISLSFTGTPIAEPDSVAVADDAGTTILPVSVVQTGNDVVATFDPPLVAGSYALAWRVRSDDTHFVQRHGCCCADDDRAGIWHHASGDCTTGDCTTRDRAGDHSSRRNPITGDHCANRLDRRRLSGRCHGARLV
jgi:methionine-rich copper-binding protein CopC